MVLKGAQKKMIVIKTGDSDIFEEAYFVVKHDGSQKESDMLAEANRIIEASGIQPSGRKNGRTEKKAVSVVFCLLVFALGIFMGGLSTLVILLAL